MKKLFFTLLLAATIFVVTPAHAIIVGSGCTTVNCCHSAIGTFCSNPANTGRFAECYFNDGDNNNPHWMWVSRVCGDPTPLLPPIPQPEGPPIIWWD